MRGKEEEEMKGRMWEFSAPGDPLIGELGDPSMEEREARDPCPSSLSCVFHEVGLSLKVTNFSKLKYMVQS